MAKNFTDTLNKSLENKTIEKQVDSPANSQVFSIPNKTKEKASTKAFNVVMDSDLVDKMDKLAKKKGYSRNQLINYMCNWCVQNMKE